MVDFKPQLGRCPANRGEAFAKATSGVARRLSDHEAYVVPRVHQRPQGRDRERRGSHENDARGALQAGAKERRTPVLYSWALSIGVHRWALSLVKRQFLTTTQSRNFLPIFAHASDSSRRLLPKPRSTILWPILRTGTPSRNVGDLARDLLVKFRDLKGLSEASVEDLKGVPGMGMVKAIELSAAFELGRRVKLINPNELTQITGPRQVYDLLAPEIANLDHEVVRVLLLNTKHRVQACVQVSEGTLNGANLRVAEIFKEPVRQQAAAIVMVHNHPSGDPTP